MDFDSRQHNDHPYTPPPRRNNGGGGGHGYDDDDDLSDAVRHAQQNTDDDEETSLFKTVVTTIRGNKHNIINQPINEQDAVQAHQQFFGEGGGQQATSASIGSAAAMEVLKVFTSGGSGNTQAGNSQSVFIGLAMAQATKLFEQQVSEGKIASGASKESAVQNAAETALKLYAQSHGGSGASGLLGSASKFL